jgi:hypothetical protein
MYIILYDADLDLDSFLNEMERRYSVLRDQDDSYSDVHGGRTLH